MAEKLLNTKLKDYEVSTIRTDAGGAAPSTMFGIGFGFSSADYESLTTWPFETMIFKVGSRRGLYHEAYASEQDAREGHERIVAAVEAETWESGKGVEGDDGNPSLTPEKWRQQELATQ